MHTKALLVLLAVSAAQIGGRLEAQAGPPHPRPDITFGYFVPLRDLGTRGVTKARLRSSPTLGLGLDLWTRTPWLGFRFASQVGMLSGLRLHGTPACTNHCSPFTDSHGRFWALAADVTARRLRGRGSFFIGLGGGLSGYLVGGVDILGLPPAGTASRDPFLEGHTAGAVHMIGGFATGLGPVGVRATVEDYIGRGISHNTLHDVVFAVGLVAGRFH